MDLSYLFLPVLTLTIGMVAGVDALRPKHHADVLSSDYIKNSTQQGNPRVEGVLKTVASNAMEAGLSHQSCSVFLCC